MPTTFLIKFGRSTSQNYAYAVEKAKSYATYSEDGAGKNIVHSVVFRDDQIKEFFDLYDIVGNWKSTSVYIDGELVPPNKMRFMYCYKECIRSYNPDEYCYGKDDASEYNDNDFGCRHTGINLYDWRGLAGYGEMDNKGMFHVHKEKLKHDVFKNIEDYMLCPAFQLDRIQQALDKIPNKINPKSNNEWEYVTEYKDGKEVAYAVRKKSKKKEFVVHDHRDIEIVEISLPSSRRQTTLQMTKRNNQSGCATSILIFVAPLVPMLLWIFHVRTLCLSIFRKTIEHYEPFLTLQRGDSKNRRDADLGPTIRFDTSALNSPVMNTTWHFRFTKRTVPSYVAEIWSRKRVERLTLPSGGGQHMARK